MTVLNKSIQPFFLSVAFMLVLLTSCSWQTKKVTRVIVVSANAEWKVVRKVYPHEHIEQSPWGEFFLKEIDTGKSKEQVIVYHGGWGKVAAAGSTQYCIDRWNPEYIINIGTCGGFEGKIQKHAIVLVNKTIIYDILEAMGDSKEAIGDYTTDIDLNWIERPLPFPVITSVMVSADKDIVAAEIPRLISSYNAVAGDWETGAIAYTCMKNKKRLLILRGVSDLVSAERGGEAYNNEGVFFQGTEIVMKKLLDLLPAIIEKCPSVKK